MPFRVSGKNLDIGEALRTRINERMAEALGKYFDGGYSGHVTVEKEGFGFRTECAIHLDSEITLHAEAWRPMPMRAPTRRRCASRSGCGAISAASRITSRAASTATRRVDAPSYVIAAPEHEDERDRRIQARHHRRIDHHC